MKKGCRQPGFILLYSACAFDDNLTVTFCRANITGDAIFKAYERSSFVYERFFLLLVKTFLAGGQRKKNGDAFASPFSY
ncbi:hypothetical protein SD77_0060 [Bacillus badius]|uniref:Mobile element protein n=1 Tax=Bacillus badius TaxID=1455 RepID=A0ABR5AZM9_BACBA|nr:hypothetical protein SD78_3386 [Bacillus badius]KIL80212.1 hypothetical protein SD77_0060 [Bacillus badius]KZR56860.1 hypothetical protein A3781_06285 [Bacillus badius]